MSAGLSLSQFRTSQHIHAYTLSHLNIQRKRDLPVSAAMMNLGDERHFVWNIGPPRALAPSLWAEHARLNT